MTREARLELALKSIADRVTDDARWMREMAREALGESSEVSAPMQHSDLDLSNRVRACIETRENLIRLKLVGPMSISSEVMHELHDSGWRTTRSGPYTDRTMHPKMDMSRFLFIAEAEVE